MRKQLLVVAVAGTALVATLVPIATFASSVGSSDLVGLKLTVSFSPGFLNVRGTGSSPGCPTTEADGGSSDVASVTAVSSSTGGWTAGGVAQAEATWPSLDTVGEPGNATDMKVIVPVHAPDGESFQLTVRPPDNIDLCDPQLGAPESSPLGDAYPVVWYAANTQTTYGGGCGYVSIAAAGSKATEDLSYTETVLLTDAAPSSPSNWTCIAGKVTATPPPSLSPTASGGLEVLNASVSARLVGGHVEPAGQFILNPCTSPAREATSLDFGRAKVPLGDSGGPYVLRFVRVTVPHPAYASWVTFSGPRLLYTNSAGPGAATQTGPFREAFGSGGGTGSFCTSVAIAYVPTVDGSQTLKLTARETGTNTVLGTVTLHGTGTGAATITKPTAPKSKKIAPSANSSKPKSRPSSTQKKRESTGAAIVDAAKSMAGSPYCWDGGNNNGPTHGQGNRDGATRCGGKTAGFDCTGLTLYAVHRVTGIELPHSGAQATAGKGKLLKKPKLSTLEPGDVLLFGTSLSHVEHSGIYAGGGLMWDANVAWKPYGDGVRERKVGWETSANALVGALRFP